MNARMERIGLYVPAYNAAEYLERCLTAVKAIEYPVERVIVIDDGSHDASASIARSMGVEVIAHECNRGLSIARRTAFSNLDTPFIASLDADCCPHPDWLTRLMAGFDSPVVAGVCGKLIERCIDRSVDYWRSRHMKQHWGDEPSDRPPYLFGNNNVFRRDAVIAAGGYPESLEYRTNYEDFYMSGRLRGRGWRLRYIPDARVDHLRRDSLTSLYRTHWNWYFQGKPRPDTMRNLVWKLRDAAYWGVRYSLKDIAKRDWRSLPISLGFAYAMARLDLNYYLDHRY